MKITEHEMRGLLAGKCIPADILVNETLPSYLVRKFFEEEDKLRIKQNHIALRDTYIAELEGSVEGLQQKLDAANAELARYSMPAGQADQFAAEAKAVRKALGFAENAEDVAPVDLLEKIAGLRAEGVEMCAAKMKQTSSLALNHIAEGILQYAAELRAETDTTPSQYESLAGGK